MDFNVLVQKSYSKPSKNPNFWVRNGGDKNQELLQNIIYNAHFNPKLQDMQGTRKG